MQPYESEPEIIPPGGRSRREERGMLDDQTLSFLASLLDDIFRVPGTGIRFGLDPLIGLIPGFGDLITSAASFLIILAAWQRRMPKVTMARMMANIAIDTLVGSIPLAGDAFDVAWKSNRKNLALLQREKTVEQGNQSWRDWLFLLGVVVLLGILVAIPIAVLFLLIHLLRR
jgi:Domain of unknown function (DUF4112)